MGAENCTTCAADPKRPPGRYCAPGRCYCGHEKCPAFDSWVDMDAVPFHDAPAPRDRKQAESWANREGATWLDRL